jgi:hypothetical protein
MNVSSKQPKEKGIRKALMRLSIKVSLSGPFVIEAPKRLEYISNLK